MSILNYLSPIFRRNPTEELESIVSSIQGTIDTCIDDLNLLELECAINSATGSWLDSWGTWFGVLRNTGEPDDEYRNRMIAVATKPKCTIPAIIESIKAFSGDPYTYVNIYEPHRNVCKYNLSSFCSADRIQDNQYWRGAVIEIQCTTAVTPELIATVELLKSAGIKVFYMKISNDSAQDDDPDKPTMHPLTSIELWIQSVVLGSFSSTETVELEYTQLPYSEYIAHYEHVCETEVFIYFERPTWDDVERMNTEYSSPIFGHVDLLSLPELSLWEVADVPLSDYLHPYDTPEILTEIVN